MRKTMLVSNGTGSTRSTTIASNLFRSLRPVSERQANGKLHLSRVEVARGVPYAGLGDPSRFVERATHPAAAGLNGQKSSAPYVVLKNRTLSVLKRLKLSAINSSFVRSSIEKLRARRRSNVFSESPTKVFRGSIPTRSFTPKTSPLASNSMWGRVQFQHSCQTDTPAEPDDRA